MGAPRERKIISSGSPITFYLSKSVSDDVVDWFNSQQNLSGAIVNLIEADVGKVQVKNELKPIIKECLQECLTELLVDGAAFSKPISIDEAREARRKKREIFSISADEAFDWKEDS